MSNPFDQYVWDLLGDQRFRLPKQARQEKYGVARRSLQTTWRNEGCSADHIRDGITQFEDAVDYIEQQIEEERRSLSVQEPAPKKPKQKIGPKAAVSAYDFVSTFSVKHLAIAAPFLAVIDFVEKLNRLLPVFVLAALAAFCVLLWAGKSNKHFGVRTAGVRSFMLVVFLLGGVCWVAQGYVDGARANGLIAETVPGADEFQRRVLAILGTLKKETSDDPRKELNNIGVQWSPEDFFKAVASGDTRAVELFMKGGMKVTQDMVSVYTRKNAHPEVGNILLRYRSQIDMKLCDSTPLALAFFVTEGNRSFALSLCDAKSVRTKIQAEAIKQKQFIESYEERRKIANAGYAQCVGELRKQHLPTRLNSMEARSAAYEMYTNALNRRKDLDAYDPRRNLVSFWSGRIGHGEDPNQAMMYGIDRSCRVLHEEPTKPWTSDLDQLNKALAVIPAG